MSSLFKFDAFISYNRNDGDFARQLEQALEHWSIPRALRSKRSRLKVFRDTDDMTGTDYDKAIRRHLDASRKLIVICSPNARKSQFVDDECAYFIEGHSPESVIPVLIDGLANNEPGDADLHAFPEALARAMRMPLAVDYRAFESGSLRGKLFRDQWYSILSSLLETSREAVEERDRKHRMKRWSLAGGLSLAVVLTTSLLANNWLKEKEEREIAQRNRQAVEVLQFAVSRQDERERAVELGRLLELPMPARVLSTVLHTGRELDRPLNVWVSADYADNYWEKRLDGAAVNNEIQPLAAYSLQDDCRPHQPRDAPLEGLRSPDGSVDVYRHGGKLFVQNTDGFGPALVYCMDSDIAADNRAGTQRRREGADGLLGRFGFGWNDQGPQHLAKDLDDRSMHLSRLIRPGRYQFALKGVEDFRFTPDGDLETGRIDESPLVVRLPRGAHAPVESGKQHCFDYDGPDQQLATLLEENGLPGYPLDDGHVTSRLRACFLNQGRVLAFVTEHLGVRGSMDEVRVIQVSDFTLLFQATTYSETCTAFARNTLSYCLVGDITGSAITAELGFVHFEGEGGKVIVEDEIWSSHLSGESITSGDGSKIMLWGTVYGDGPAIRPALVWLEGQADFVPVVIDQSSSPVKKALFSEDGLFAAVLRENGDFRLVSFDAELLIESLLKRVAPLDESTL